MLTNAEPRLTTISEPVSLIAPRWRRRRARRAGGRGACSDASLQVALALDAVDDRLALRQRPRGDADVAELVVVHRRLVRGDVGHAAGADDQHVLLLMSSPLSLVSCSGQARSKSSYAELADDLDGAVEATDDDRRHAQPVEPRRLDHRVPGGVGEPDLVADAQRRVASAYSPKTSPARHVRPAIVTGAVPAGGGRHRPADDVP